MLCLGWFSFIISNIYAYRLPVSVSVNKIFELINEGHINNWYHVNDIQIKHLG